MRTLKDWFQSRDLRPIAGTLVALVLFIVYATCMRYAPPSAPLEQQLAKSRAEVVSLQKQLAEATRSAEVSRVTAETLASELESARKRTRTIVKEVFRDGQVVERTTDNRTDDQVVKNRRTETKTASESVRIVEVVRVATETVYVAATESLQVTQRNDTHNGAFAGTVIAPSGVGFALGYSPLKAGPMSLDVLGGSALPFSPFLGVGLGLEVVPRLSVGAAYLVEPLGLRHYPALSLTHRF